MVAIDDYESLAEQMDASATSQLVGTGRQTGGGGSKDFQVCTDPLRQVCVGERDSVVRKELAGTRRGIDTGIFRQVSWASTTLG